MKTSHIIFLAVASCIMASACDYKKANRHVPESRASCIDESFGPQLEMADAKREVLKEQIPLTGSVEPNPDKVVQYVSLVSGVISNTRFSIGDRVSKGQVLAELHSTELSALQSQLQGINSQIGVAEQKLRSVQSMFDDGISSQKDLMKAQSELDILRSERRRVQADLQLFSASSSRGVFLIKAPASGIITSKSVSSGTQINSGDLLFTVADLSEVWIMVNIYATNVQNIQPGTTVSISTLAYPDITFSGKVNAISQIYDQEARVLKARVVMQNTGMKLKPGMLVDVIAIREQKVEATAIPTSAIVFDDDQNFVLVFRNYCDIDIRKVGILHQSNGTTYIDDGLMEGEKVVTKNQLLVFEQIKNFQK